MSDSKVSITCPKCRFVFEQAAGWAQASCNVACPNCDALVRIRPYGEDYVPDELRKGWWDQEEGPK